MDKTQQTHTVEDLQNSEEVIELSKSFDEVANKLLNGQSPQKILKIDDKALEGLYAQAYRLYGSGKYEEAVHLFRILIMMKGSEPKYLLGLAACLHMMKEFKSAIQTYTMCSVIDPKDPMPHYHSSDCFIQMENYLSAAISLELVLIHTENKPEFSKVRERALLSLNKLKAQASSE